MEPLCHKAWHIIASSRFHALKIESQDCSDLQSVPLFNLKPLAISPGSYVAFKKKAIEGQQHKHWSLKGAIRLAQGVSSILVVRPSMEAIFGLRNAFILRITSQKMHSSRVEGTTCNGLSHCVDGPLKTKR